MLFGKRERTLEDYIFTISRGRTNVLRKQDAEKRLDYYQDQQTAYLQEEILRQYANPDSLQPLFVNLVRKIINNLAMVYMEPPKREVDGTDRDQDIFSQIAEATALSLKMKTASRFTKLFKTCLLRPVWRHGEMDIDILTPDILDVLTGDTPADLKAVMIKHEAESGRPQDTTYKVWTPERVTTLDSQGRAMNTEDNPYGVLPFVVLWDSVPGAEFWIPGGDDLIVAQDALQLKFTDFLHVLKFQGFGVGYIKGGDFGTELEVGAGQFIEVGEDGEIGYASPNAPIEEFLNSIIEIAKQVAVANGLSATTLSTEPTQESGIAKMLGSQELKELRSDDMELFRTYERKLFEMLRVVWNYHNPGKQISQEAALTVDFYEPSAPVSETERVAKWETELSLGIVSPVDIVMERNPDLKDRDEAKEYLKMIKAESGEFANYGSTQNQDFLDNPND